MDDDLRIEKITCGSQDFSRLLAVLNLLDGEYVPPLSSYINIDEYASKLVKRAEVWIASTELEDVGVVAFYANNSATKEAFISTIGVIPSFRGKGLGLKLIEKAAQIAKDRGMLYLALEVSGDNVSAINLYARCGFKRHKDAGVKTYEKSLIMRKHLS